MFWAHPTAQFPDPLPAEHLSPSPAHLLEQVKHLLTFHLLTCLTCWIRLVPVAIAGFRYTMVCHAVFVHNRGGEKKVIYLTLCKAQNLLVGQSRSQKLLLWRGTQHQVCDLMFKVWMLWMSSLSTLSLVLCIIV